MPNLYSDFAIRPYEVGPPKAAHVGPPQAPNSRDAGLLALALSEFSRQLHPDGDRNLKQSSLLAKDVTPPDPTHTFTADHPANEDLLERYDAPLRQMLALEQLFNSVKVANTEARNNDLASSAGMVGETPLWTVTCPLPPTGNDALVSETKAVEEVNEPTKSESRRRTEQLAELVLQADAAPYFMLAVVGATPVTHPYTIECLDAAGSLASAVLHPIKHTFRTPRPSTRSARIVPLIHTPSHYSFPSGHATYVYCAAELLAALAGQQHPDPGDLRSALQRAAALIADNRVVAGVHYPADSDAGRAIGFAIGRWLVRQGSKTMDVKAELANATYSVAEDKGKLRATLAFGKTDDVGLAETPRWRWLMYRAAQEWKR
jgi:hypothetical protein